MVCKLIQRLCITVSKTYTMYTTLVCTWYQCAHTERLHKDRDDSALHRLSARAAPVDIGAVHLYGAV